MTGRNICFKGVLWEIIPRLSLLPLLIWSTDALYAIMPLFCLYCDCFKDVSLLYFSKLYVFYSFLFDILFHRYNNDNLVFSVYFFSL